MKEYEDEELQDRRKKCYTAIDQFIEDIGLENIPDRCARDWCKKHCDCAVIGVYRNSDLNYIYITGSGLHHIIKKYYDDILNPYCTFEDNVNTVIKALGIEPKDIMHSYIRNDIFIALYLPKIKQEVNTNNEYNKIPWGK